MDAEPQGQAPATTRGAGAERWRAFDPAWYRFAYPMVDPLLSDQPDRTPEAIYRSIGTVLFHAPNPYFSESWYLDQYPAVREAIGRGDYVSGFEHFCRSGYTSLAPHWLFNPDYYRQRLAQAYRRPHDPAQDGELYDHFLRVGQFQGLSGHWLFEPQLYAATAPYDVAARIRQDGAFTTFLHQIAAGGAEPVVSLLFDSAWYRERYPGVAEGIRDGRWACALQHYQQSAEAAAFDPCGRFSETKYRAYHADVQGAIRDHAFRNGFDHYLRHGRAEGRTIFPAGPAWREDTGIPLRPAPVTAGFPLRTAEFASVTFLPVERVPAGWRFGAVDEAGRGLDAFPHSNLTPGTSIPPARVLSGPHIYGGLLVNDLDRFLLDGMARLWFLRQRPDLPVLWQWDATIRESAWPDWITQLWQLLGLHRHQHVHVRGVVRAEQVILPDAGRQTQHTLHPDQVRALAVHAGADPAPGRRVWLSRRGLPEGERRLAPEDRIEALLQEKGWTVLRPATLPLVAQAELFASAEVVASCVGAAFHSALLCARPTARLIAVTHPAAMLQTHDLIAHARGLRQSYVVPEVIQRPGTPSGPPAEVRDVARLVAAIIEAADRSAAAPGPPCSLRPGAEGPL